MKEVKVVDNLWAAECRTWLKIGIRKGFPKKLNEIVRKAQRRRARPITRAKVDGANKANIPTIGFDELVHDLRRSNIGAGRDIMVHSALSKVGPIDGGARCVIGALREIVGDGTLLMPCYPMPTTAYNWMCSDSEFDVTKTKSQMGALTEVFRLEPGVIRSAHPTHSVAALGGEARQFIEAHHEIGCPCGLGSPFSTLQKNEGLVLCLGSQIGKVTQYHVIEDEVKNFPLEVYLPRAMAKTVIFEDGRKKKIATRVHDPFFSPWRIDSFYPKEIEFEKIMQEHNVLRYAKFGEAKMGIIDVAKLEKLLHQLLNRGITIYHRPRLLFS